MGDNPSTFDQAPNYCEHSGGKRGVNTDTEPEAVGLSEVNGRLGIRFSDLNRPSDRRGDLSIRFLSR
jgi:hypothetical protein